jgi:hypothetical protein
VTNTVSLGSLKVILRKDPYPQNLKKTALHCLCGRIPISVRYYTPDETLTKSNRTLVSLEWTNRVLPRCIRSLNGRRFVKSRCCTSSPWPGYSSKISPRHM